MNIDPRGAVDSLNPIITTRFILVVLASGYEHPAFNTCCRSDSSSTRFTRDDRDMLFDPTEHIMLKKARNVVETTIRDAKDLDRIDRKILDELQSSGRAPVAELARRVHLSLSPCRKRVQRLEREGFIKDYVARLDAKRMGFDLLAYVEVRLTRSDTPALGGFRDAICALDEVVECQMTSGNFDYLLKIHAVSMDTLSRFVVEKINSIPGVRHTRTFFSMGEVKATTKLSTSPSPSRGRGRRRRA
jgi:Lrp/AsnC family transcriptional regulator, leucine-responsive regulatory protein